MSPKMSPKTEMYCAQCKAKWRNYLPYAAAGSLVGLPTIWWYLKNHWRQPVEGDPPESKGLVESDDIVDPRAFLLAHETLLRDFPDMAEGLKTKREFDLIVLQGDLKELLLKMEKLTSEVIEAEKRVSEKQNLADEIRKKGDFEEIYKAEVDLNATKKEQTEKIKMRESLSSQITEKKKEISRLQQKIQLVNDFETQLMNDARKKELASELNTLREEKLASIREEKLASKLDAALNAELAKFNAPHNAKFENDLNEARALLKARYENQKKNNF